MQTPQSQGEGGARANVYVRVRAGSWMLFFLKKKVTEGCLLVFEWQTIDKLNVLLDVEEPFTILLHDRTGISEIRPADEVLDYMEKNS